MNKLDRCIVLVLVFVIFISPLGMAEIDAGRLCNAIRIAEGVHSRHPYGIMRKFKHTTPRQACLNTVRHQESNWKKEGAKGDYLTYLGGKYAPVNSDTDNGTNKFWIGNVRKLYGA